jgi:hypothetical protein
VLLAGTAGAADQPVAGRKLLIKRAASGAEKLVFASRDPAFLFPAIGGSDDPASGSPGGAMVEVFTQTGGQASYVVPPGLGKPGWRVKEGARDVYKFVDPPSGALSALRVLVLKEGKLLKVVAKTTGLPLTGPLGAAGIRVTTGGLRSCAGFDAATIRQDVAGTYVAMDAPASTLADCSDASLAALAPCGDTPFPECGGGCPAGSVCSSQDLATCTCVSSADPCGDTFPVCNGTCPAGEACFSQGSPPFVSCTCAPIGTTPCGSSAFPVCGGDCPAGATCDPITNSSPFIQDGCGCSAAPCGGGGTQCPPGFMCAIAPGFQVCAPIPCGGDPTYPTCDGACPAGWGCHALEIADAAFTTCLCAPPGACDGTCGGFDCGPGGVCVTDTALSTCGCK